MKTVGIVSLGCPKNLVDSELILGALEKQGYKVVQDPAQASILIVNTCGFIEDAKRESIDAILEMAKYKKLNCKKLIVAGCLPQRYKSQLKELLPEVDEFIGTELKNIHNASTPRKLATPKHAVYVKIAEGCFHGCSFCIIPKLRGKFRSRPMDDIVNEAKMFLKGGAKELNLIAQDTTSYGKGLKDGSSLAKLIRSLNKLDGDFWVRIMYAYPTSITDEFISAVEECDKVCKYLDIPIQHINNKILKAMRRKERGEDIRELIKRLRIKIPQITLRTSLIVGFPGETKKEFDELLSFVKEGHFDHLGTFIYSKEEGTFAAKLSKQAPKNIAEKRRNIIMEAQAEVSKERNKMWLGKKIKALAESFSVARAERQAPDIDGIIKVNNNNAGDFIEVKITGFDEYDLKGEIDKD